MAHRSSKQRFTTDVDTSVNRTSSIPCAEGKRHHWVIDENQLGVCLNCSTKHQFVHSDTGGAYDSPHSVAGLVDRYVKQATEPLDGFLQD